MKTAETIETSEERKAQQAEVAEKKKRGPYKQNRSRTPDQEAMAAKRAAQLAQLKPFHWQPGQSGNPSGKPKQDVAHKIARAAFENNAEALYEAFSRALLKGNAYAFSQLADRAYGKIAEKIELSPGAEYRDMNTEALIERVKQLEAKLGVAVQTDDPRRTGIHSVGIIPAHFEKED